MSVVYSRLSREELQALISDNPSDSDHYIKAKAEMARRGWPEYVPYPAWLYHPDKPAGKVVNSYEEARGHKELGWVDSPAKIGQTIPPFSPTRSYKWSPITDLEQAGFLGHRGIHALAKVWQNYKKSVGNSVSLSKFLDRLNREWAIETGIIERLYDLDHGTTQVLLERGFEASLIPHGDKPSDWIAKVLEDNREALQVLFDFVAGGRELSTSFVKELQVLLTRHQESAEGVDQFGSKIEIPLLRGDWKRLPNNPRRPDGEIHEYCPPEQVASEMDRLLEMHADHVEDGVPVEVEAAWLHHRFTQIHPFQDGNGRVARALSTLLLIRADWLPLVVHRSDRNTYLNALEQADDGDVLPLISLFVKIEEKAFTQALTAVTPPAETLLDAAAELLRDSFGVSPRDKKKAEEVGIEVFNAMLSRLQRFLEHANKNLSSAGFGLEGFGAGPNKPVHKEIDPALPSHLKPLPFMRHEARLFSRQPKMEVICVGYAAGPLFRGVMVASLLQRRDDGSLAQVGEPFVFTLDESPGSARERAAVWFEEILSLAIGSWLRRLQQTPPIDPLSS